MAKKFSRFKSGQFHPANPEKYKGKLPIIYRSSWELHAIRWLDQNPSCLSWASESAIVNYYLNGTKHRYFVDLTATFKTKSGDKKFYIEVKPYKQTIPPKPSARKKQKTFNEECLIFKKNTAKWEAAREFAHRKGGEFVILTEKHLFKD